MVNQLIFVINSGSSSLKFQLIEMPSEEVKFNGIFERIGAEQADLTYTYQGVKHREELLINTHREAVDYLLQLVLDIGVVSSLEEVEGVGHRVAHGGTYADSQLVTGEVLDRITQLNQFAPSHNPVNVLGIEAFQKALPKIGQVAVFDTSFHQTLEEEYFLYPLPYRYYDNHQIRKYGFHGTSHQYIATTVAELLGDTPNQKVISCHLGNGASICAIRDGLSVNTSMGFTPLAGLMMGSRSGDIDPSIVTYLQTLGNKSPEEIEDVMNRESGLLGVSGLSNDLRDIEHAAAQGNHRAELAIKMFNNRVAQTIATYIVDLQGVDCLVFTAGIGENSKTMRSSVCQLLSVFGIEIDEEKNHQGATFIQKDSSQIKVAIIPTNEEIMIARDVVRLT